jgi:hypothetical protein
MISAHSRKILALVITLMLAAVTTAPVHAEATTIVERTIVNLADYDVSITACNGEEVPLTGKLHLTSQTTIDAGGRIHERLMTVTDGVSGVGADTGTQYKTVGGDRWTWNYTADADYAPYSFTQTDLLNLVSPGGTDNLQAKFTFHLTVDLNGLETAVVDASSVECVG